MVRASGRGKQGFQACRIVIHIHIRFRAVQSYATSEEERYVDLLQGLPPRSRTPCALGELEREASLRNRECCRDIRESLHEHPSQVFVQFVSH